MQITPEIFCMELFLYCQGIFLNLLPVTTLPGEIFASDVMFIHHVDGLGIKSSSMHLQYTSMSCISSRDTFF